ncbi:uncharacterized protein [Littorina saxatilis]|uniref:uncharacterized protein n=1 Tax=Littorina saxatilis TaxID=31220 RepID=UPI0038B50D7B
MRLTFLSDCFDRECPEGSRICSTRNRTCPENIGQEEVTQSCEGSEPCGVMLTITNVRDCDGGTYSCYVFSSVDVRKYEAASVTLTVKDCEENTYGPECSDKCGRCAGNQTCNTTTGYCPACLDGWISPRCTEAVPEAPLLTPNEKVAVGVAVGGAVSWGFMASLIQLCQILGNAGWMPFLRMGGKKEEKKKEGDDAEESSDEEEPPSKCFRFLKCILCGGAGFCLISFLCCISRGKLMSKKVRSRKKKNIQKESSASDNNMTTSMNILPDNSSSVDTGLPGYSSSPNTSVDRLPGNSSYPYTSVYRLPGNSSYPYTSVYRLPGESSTALESQSQTNLNHTQDYLYHR